MLWSKLGTGLSNFKPVQFLFCLCLGVINHNLERRKIKSNWFVTGKNKNIFKSLCLCVYMQMKSKRYQWSSCRTDAIKTMPQTTQIPLLLSY